MTAVRHPINKIKTNPEGILNVKLSSDTCYRVNTHEPLSHSPGQGTSKFKLCLFIERLWFFFPYMNCARKKLNIPQIQTFFLFTNFFTLEGPLMLYEIIKPHTSFKHLSIDAPQRQVTPLLCIPQPLTTQPLDTWYQRSLCGCHYFLVG